MEERRALDVRIGEHGERLSALERAIFGDENEEGLTRTVRGLRDDIRDFNSGIKVVKALGIGLGALLVAMKTGDWTALKSWLGLP